MTIRPPRTLKVLGQKVSVKFVKDVDTAVDGVVGHDHEEKGRVGHADMRFGLIHVSTLQSDDQFADTYLHETLHAMLMLVGHDDETTVFRVTPVLLDFLRKNPRFVEFIMQKRLVSR